MGEKGATKDVIDGLLEALRGDDDSVRERACDALGCMGEKGATNDVINGLLEALRSVNDSVRERACYALVGMGEKGATKEVIDGLLDALKSDDGRARRFARHALVHIGEKIAAKEVIISLDCALEGEWSKKQESLTSYAFRMYEGVRDYLILMSALGVFWDPEFQTGDAGEIAMKCVQRELISPVRLVKVCIEKGEQMFLRGALYACVITETAVAIHGNCLCIYDREGVRKISIPPGSESLVDELRKGACRAIGQLDLKVHIDWNRA
ncbi:unnamed protein product [Adineta ricciae]|uniref:HEAT repeat domain-containing protein n=2 Tax=Adineta ricciae TaxID=249248 RepID=A0A816FZ82_ADIRI|nr:unnamed protein product [Adineta ricciae]